MSIDSQDESPGNFPYMEKNTLVKRTFVQEDKLIDDAQFSGVTSAVDSK